MALARDNRHLVSDLFTVGRLRVAVDPAQLEPPRSSTVPWDRVAGMLTGLAVGDALGNTSESLVPAERRRRHGEIRDYLPNWHADERRVGLPSDDTQLAFWTIEQMLEDGGLVPDRLAARFASGRIFGMGSTVHAFLKEWSRSRDWLASGQESAGNGGLMRIAPVVLPHLHAPTAALWSDAALAGSVTHNDYASNAACVGFVALLWEALATKPPVPPGFWLERFIEMARRIEGDTPRYEARCSQHAGQLTTTWAFTQRVVSAALQANVPTVEACDGWYSGAFLLETVPSVLYVLERHGNAPEEAIIRGVNDTRDNDTVAAVVGAAVGALHGIDRLPRRWRDGLLGRTREDDNGRMWAIIQDAGRAWGDQAAGAGSSKE